LRFPENPGKMRKGAARKGSPCVNALRALSGVNALHCACVSRENACIMKTVR